MSHSGKQVVYVAGCAAYSLSSHIPPCRVNKGHLPAVKEKFFEVKNEFVFLPPLNCTRILLYTKTYHSLHRHKSPKSHREFSRNTDIRCVSVTSQSCLKWETNNWIRSALPVPSSSVWDTFKLTTMQTMQFFPTQWMCLRHLIPSVNTVVS